MKLPEVKKLFKTIAVTAVLSLIIPTSACSLSMKFSTKENLEHVTSNDSKIDVALSQEIVDIISSSDFKNNEDLENISSTVCDYGEDIVNRNDNLSSFQKASLVRVVDGDTIIVDIYGDSCGNKEHEYSVRMIGINTEESVASEEYLNQTGKENTEEGKAASEFTKELLNNTEYLYLEKDISDTDKYNRLLRYIWLDYPSDDVDLEDISTKMINGILLKENIAEVATYQPDTKYEQEFIEISNMY